MKINENVYRNCPIIVLGQFFLSMKNFFNEMKSDLKFSAYFELFEFFFLLKIKYFLYEKFYLVL